MGMAWVIGYCWVSLISDKSVQRPWGKSTIKSWCWHHISGPGKESYQAWWNISSPWYLLMDSHPPNSSKTTGCGSPCFAALAVLVEGPHSAQPAHASHADPGAGKRRLELDDYITIMFRCWYDGPLQWRFYHIPQLSTIWKIRTCRNLPHVILLISPDVSFSPTPEKWSVTSPKDDSGVETPETAVDTPAEPAACGPWTMVLLWENHGKSQGFLIFSCGYYCDTNHQYIDRYIDSVSRHGEPFPTIQDVGSSWGKAMVV